MKIRTFGEPMNGFPITNQYKIYSNSKGNVVKLDNGERFFKTGRYSPYNYEGKFSIESLNEVICFILGKHLGLDTLEYKLAVEKVDFHNKKAKIVGCISDNFLDNGKDEYTLNDLYLNNLIEAPTYEGRTVDYVNKQYVDKVILFDYIIYNTDRHANNIVWYSNINGDLEPGLIFDNGYSLLFDDLPNLLKGNFELSMRTSTINAFYNNFNLVGDILRDNLKYNEDISHLLTINFNREEFLNNLLTLNRDYQSLEPDTDYNVIVNEEYFFSVYNFICHRLDKLNNMIEEVRDDLW